MAKKLSGSRSHCLGFVQTCFSCFAVFTVLSCSLFASPHAHAAEQNFGVSHYKSELKNLSRADLVPEISRVISAQNPDENLKAIIDLNIWKLQTLAKLGDDEATAELANYIYKTYDRESYHSELHYGQSMHQIVESLAKTEKLTLAYEIIQHLRESVYEKPSVYLEYIIDTCLIEVYIEAHDFEQALSVALKVLENTNYKSIDEVKKKRLSLLNEVAYLYNQLGDGENALKYLRLASEAFDFEGLSPAKLTKAKARNSGNLGRAYLLTGDYTEAEKMGHEALAGGIAIKDDYLMSLGYRLIGTANYHLGNSEKSLQALKSAIKIAESKKVITIQKPLYKDYALALEKAAKYDEALIWYKKLSALEAKEQTALILTRSNLSDLEFEAFKAHQKIVTLQDENEGQRAIAERDKDIKKLLGLTVISLILGGSFLIYLLNYLSKSKRKILRQANEVEAANERLQMSALLDPLTGLPNRLAVNAQLNEHFKRADLENLHVAVAHIDFDHFKEINDKYGHPAGDFVLVEISKRMKDWGRPDNFVARIGGDEFLAVLSTDQGPDMIEQSLENLLDLISKPINFEGITMPSSASIGAAVYPTQSEDSDELIVCADLALYEAKNNGRGRLRFFNQKMIEDFNSRKTLEAELIVAMDSGQITPYFQPKSNISTHKITGVEALIRWNHETRGFISPDEFLPVAESAGLMVSLGRHLMEKAIREAARWYDLNISFGRLALNASASELNESDFEDWLLATAKKYNLPPSRLSIEIVETVMIKDVRFKLEDKLERMRQAGIHIELDDFGTGYASLQQLNADEIDGLKIDCSFIKNIQDNPSNAAIVSAMVNLANTLNIDIVAEGAETFEELETLLELGCYIVQGFGIARPMPASIAGDWIKAVQVKQNSRNDENEFKGPADGTNGLRLIS